MKVDNLHAGRLKTSPFRVQIINPHKPSSTFYGCLILFGYILDIMATFEVLLPRNDAKALP